MRRINGASVQIMLILLVAGILISGQTANADFVFGEPARVNRPGQRGSTEYGASISADGLEMYLDDWENGRTHIYVATRATKDDFWSESVPLGPAVNSGAFEWDPCISADGLELYFASNREGTTYDGFQIYVSRRQSVHEPWQPAENLGPAINSSFNQTLGSISADGLELYYGTGSSYQSGNELRVATRETRDSAWTETRVIAPSIRGTDPAISPGGLHLLFSGSLAGGMGDQDLWMMTRATVNDEWGVPLNLGSPINSNMAENRPWISYDGLTLLFSLGAIGADIQQASILPVIDLNIDGVVDALDLHIIANHWGENYPLCDIGPTPFGDGVVDGADLEVFYEYVDQDQVILPTPVLNATGVAPFVNLGWTRGIFAETYDVYFGTSPDDVRDANRTSPMDVLVSQDQIPNIYEIEGALDYGQTYYWRVDEVNASAEPSIVKGPVWNFTVIPWAESAMQTINVIAVTASSMVNAEPERTIDGSGLDADDLHGTNPDTMWLSAADGPQPIWIQYEFDGTYPMDALWVWNYNMQFEWVLGYGFQDVLIEYSEDGVDWTSFGEVAFAQGTSRENYSCNTTVEFGGVMARYMRLTALDNWGGAAGQSGLSEVRFFYVSPVDDGDTNADN